MNSTLQGVYLSVSMVLGMNNDYVPTQHQGAGICAVDAVLLQNII
jgi:hypothetical protein